MLPDLPDMPPQQQEMVVCSIAAGVAYAVPVNIVLAVAQQESGKPGQWVRNDNGTFDVGAMQFNTAYLRELARYGISAAHVAGPGCFPYQLAAWRLRGHLRGGRGDIWTRVANYHSRTPFHNQRYRAQLIRRASAWERWLGVQFPVHVVDEAAMVDRQAE
jgi:soluble lytic murein transglycosylase-like protein